MNKQELITAVSAATGQTKPTVSAVLDGILDAIKASESVTLHKFGKFSYKNRAERIGHNLQTGTQMKIPAKVVLVFKAVK